MIGGDIVELCKFTKSLDKENGESPVSPSRVGKNHGALNPSKWS